MIAKKFGDWTVDSFSHTNANHHKYWNCVCVCGTARKVKGCDLKNGTSTHCGCKRKMILNGEFISKSATYQSWRSMKKRCSLPNRKDFKNYGGRGISVCNRWKNSFMNFFEDMGVKPPSKSLDRIDNDKGYSPDNCKWSTTQEQMSNRRPRSQWNESTYNIGAANHT